MGNLVGDLGGFGSIADLAKDILDKVIPDPGAAAAAKLKVDELAQAGELAHLDATTREATGQLEVNKAEASSSSLFVGGWRPFVGWVCGVSLAFALIGVPVLTWGTSLFGHTVTFPVIDADTLKDMLYGLLGLGTMRSVEKLGGVHTTAIAPAGIVGAAKTALRSITSR